MTKTDKIKAIQKAVGALADGLIGDDTLCLIAKALGVSFEEPKAAVGRIKQSDIRTNTSAYGKAGDESNIVSVVPPYPLYFEGKYVSAVRVHKYASAALMGALQEIETAYGRQRIHELHLDDYAGAYTFKKTASGKTYSMHAYGLAIDFYASANDYHTASPKAAFSKTEYKKFVDIMEKWGWMSLGRRANYDWMHFQYTRWDS